MSTETHACRSCEEHFVIAPEDFDFYKKIDVPPPTWCPECRTRRRYAWRNERVLYRRNCDLCGKSTVTIYSPNKPFKVYCPPCWWSDNWSALDYGRDFDFSRPFFPQWHEVQLQVPRIALLTKNSVNSDYTNHSGDNKNCYLGFGVWGGENDIYCTNMYDGATRDCVDCYHVTGGGELLYECIDCEGCYGCQYGMLLRNCRNCLYCYDCRGSSDCLLSWNLRNRQYCILNVQYSKEEYFEKLKEFRLDTHEGREHCRLQWEQIIEERAVHRFAIIERSSNVSGDSILSSKNVHNSFQVEECEDVRYAIVATAKAKDSMDSYHFGINCELIYESQGLTRGYNVHFTHLCYDDSHIEYCDLCHNSENLFGCVGVKKGSYCILNKRYGEEEYRQLREKIVSHMRATGEYGEFFPLELSPIGYNETQGQVYMPLTREEVTARGWKWEEQMPGTFGKETIQPEKLPATIAETGDSIISEILRCTECNRNYNIVQPELVLYRRFKMPPPRRCPDCRYRAKIALRSPRKLWRRRCMCDYVVRPNSASHVHHPESRCPNEFDTAHDPAGKKVVYCEQCYNIEIV